MLPPETRQIIDEMLTETTFYNPVLVTKKTKIITSILHWCILEIYSDLPRQQKNNKSIDPIVMKQSCTELLHIQSYLMNTMSSNFCTTIR